jgi:hypothetical protein
VSVFCECNVCFFLSVPVFMCTYVFMCIMFMPRYAPMYVCMHTRMYVCMYVCINELMNEGISIQYNAKRIPLFLRRKLV